MQKLEIQHLQFLLIYIFVTEFWLLSYLTCCISTTFKGTTSILKDDRFKVMFENPEYQVDEQSEEYRLLNPIVSKVSQQRRKKLLQLAEHEDIPKVQYQNHVCSLQTKNLIHKRFGSKSLLYELL